MRVEEVPTAEARQAMLEAGADPTFVEGGLSYWASLVDNPEPVIDTTALLGRPALTYREWAEEHADEFRVLPA
jgi:hypothetical protein